MFSWLSTTKNSLKYIKLFHQVPHLYFSQCTGYLHIHYVSAWKYYIKQQIEKSKKADEVKRSLLSLCSLSVRGAWLIKRRNKLISSEKDAHYTTGHTGAEQSARVGTATATADSGHLIM